MINIKNTNKICFFKKRLWIAGSYFCFVLPLQAQNNVQVNGLRTDLLLPLENVNFNILSRHPSFSWEMSGNKNGIFQTAYQILISTNATTLKSDEGDVWNSGKVRSSQSSGIEYTGRTPLLPGTTYYWKVRVWDEKGKESAWSSPIAFTTDKVLKDYAT